MKWNNLWIFPIAILAIGLPMWVVPYTQLKSLHTYLLILVAVVAFALSVFTRITPWKVAIVTEV